MAMKFDIKEAKAPTWFPFDSSEPDGPAVAIRLLDYSDVREISKEVTKQEKTFLENKDGEFKRVDDIDTNEEKRIELITCRSICNWRGIEDGDGKPYEVNDENKMFLYFNWDEFRKLVDKGREVLRKNQDEQAGKEKKN